MRKILFVLLLACAGACVSQAQVVDTTVCDVLKNPATFNGKTVRIKGTVSAGFDQFIVRGPDCGQPVDGIWLAYPDGTKGKAGPDALLELQAAHNFSGKFAAPARTPVTLEKDKEFKKFDSLLAKERDPGADTCLGCRKNEVNATLVGRLDGVANATLQRDAAGKIIGLGGFGNLNAYPARLVLQSVSDVTAKEIDYSKIAEITKGMPPAADPPSTSSDLLAATSKAAVAIGDIPTGVQAQKDAAVYGKPGENNGIVIGFANINEVTASGEAQAAEDAPGGVLFKCTLNKRRVQGDELAWAMLHMGQHIFDLRNLPADAPENVPLSYFESNAWAVTASAAIAARQRFFTLPGGYMVWDWKWQSTDIAPNFKNAMDGFFANEALLSH
jgi:hypothetical protein